MTEENTTTPSSELSVSRRRVLSGIVISNKMKDTIVVAVTRYVKHPKYKKYVKQMKKYKVHDEGNTKQVGERVEIQETRPISKDKHFRILQSETT